MLEKMKEMLAVLLTPGCSNPLYLLQLNYKFAMDAAHAVMLLDPRRVHDDLLSDEPQHDLDNASPDTTARIKHIDATNERLKEKTHDLETMRYLEEDLKD